MDTFIITNMKHDNEKHLTAENGRPVADNQNTQTAGVRGPVTLQDPWLVEKLAHFDREVIPERRMHAKGSGRMVPSLSLTTYQPTRVPRYSRRWASVPTASCASLRWRGSVALPMQSAIFAALQ